MTRRIVVHDYSGHPFQVQLSRELARRGHRVEHQYCSSYISGHGNLSVGPGDPLSFSVRDVRLARPFAKYTWGMRLVQEVEYAVRATRAIRQAEPDVVLLCNIPLLANLLVSLLLRVRRQPYALWHQDVYSAAIRGALAGRSRFLGVVLGTLADRVERSIIKNARRVVAITTAFLPVYDRWGVSPSRVVVIPNWAPLDEIPVRDEPSRAWLDGADVREHLVVYSGTLGIKHDPSILLALAQSPELDDCTVVVVSQGRGRVWLDERVAEISPGRLLTRDFVSHDLLPDVLASADVVVAILEPEASKYSVPSKMLSYMCAGRPIAAVMDLRNAAAEQLQTNEMGVVLDSGDAASLAGAVRSLLDDPAVAQQMGKRARSYAETHFAIGGIAAAFEAALLQSGPEAGEPRSAS